MSEVQNKNVYFGNVLLQLTAIQIVQLFRHPFQQILQLLDFTLISVPSFDIRISDLSAETSSNLIDHFREVFLHLVCCLLGLHLVNLILEVTEQTLYVTIGIIRSAFLYKRVR